MENPYLKSFERRKEPRQSYSGCIFFATAMRLYEAELKNFSQHGLFIKTHHPLSMGETITVALPFSSKEDQKRKGHIIRCSREGFGVRLTKKLNGMAPHL